MKVSISELFEYRQYKDAPLAYCFDRKKYEICDISFLHEQNDDIYQRFIPLLQIDEEKIQESFIRSLNDKKILRQYKTSEFNFSVFVESPAWLWPRWREYYRKTVFDLEKEWCENNSIYYIDDVP